MASKANSANKIKNTHELIKGHLGYDGENYNLPKGFSLARITATHGTDIKSALHLITEGEFPGGFHGLRDEFYVTPNPKSGLNVDTLQGIKDVDDYDWASIDAIETAIQYASSINANESQGVSAEDAGVGVSLGAVIAFSGKLSLQGSEINIDPTTQIEGAHGIELVLQQAPNIEAIQGIYPVDQASAYFLQDELALRTS